MTDFHTLTAAIRQDWRADALCAQVSWDEFHADQTEGGIEAINFAKKVCRLCTVQQHCLEWALAANERQGVWGGLSPKKRDEIRKQRGITSSIPKPEFASWHGTAAGAMRHHRNGTKVCDACCEADRRRRRGLAS